MADFVGHDEPPERHLDGRGEAGGEQVRGGQLWVHGEQLVLATRRQLDAVPEKREYFEILMSVLLTSPSPSPESKSRYKVQAPSPKRQHTPP